YLYLEYDGLAHEAGGRYQRLIYRTLTLDSWSEPVVLKEYWYHAGETNEVMWSNVKAVRDAEGGIHMVYEHEENIGSWQESRDASDIRYLYFDSASVVSDIQLSSSATDTAFPSVALASDGTAHVAWREGYSYAASSGTPVVRHVYGNGISGWSAVETVSPMWTDAFALAINSTGAPAVILKNADGLHASRRESGLWSSAAPLAGLNAENASNLHLFAPTGGAYQLFYRYGASSTGWQYRAHWAEFTLDADGSSAQVIRQKDIINESGADTLQNLSVLPALDGAYHILYINSIPGGNNRAGHAFFAHGAVNFDRYVSSEIMSVDSFVLAGASLSNAVRVYFSGYLSGQSKLLYNRADYAAYAGAAAQQESVNVQAIVE
ncbi:MAG: hypothetical protein U1C18_02105, partial [Patescibacteria group bacterium]|nr:hypothetical protein [Patescibacteria group bacterium]